VRDDPSSLEALSTAELRRMCTDLSISAALAVPGGAGQAAIKRELGRAAAVLDSREAPRSDRPSPGSAHAG
jgi:hypothetical protein